MNKIKWFTISEHIDEETGEIITPREFKKEYYKIETIKKIEKNESSGIIKYQHIGRNLRQGKLF